MKKRIALSVIFIICFSVLWTQEYYYLETTGKNRSEPVVKISRNAELGVYDLFTTKPLSLETHSITLDDHFSTLKWINAQKDGSSITCTRSNNTILIQGTSNGVNVNKTRDIDEAPWFASIDFGLGEFVRGGKGNTVFWIIQPGNYKVLKMAATRVSREKADVNGSPVDTVKVRVTVENVPSLFFSYNYWFTETDGLFIRFEGAFGGPGTPKTITQFIRKE